MPSSSFEAIYSRAKQDSTLCVFLLNLWPKINVIYLAFKIDNSNKCQLDLSTPLSLFFSLSLKNQWHFYSDCLVSHGKRNLSPLQGGSASVKDVVKSMPQQQLICLVLRVYKTNHRELGTSSIRYLSHGAPNSTHFICFSLRKWPAVSLCELHSSSFSLSLLSLWSVSNNYVYKWFVRVVCVCVCWLW